MSGEEHPEPLKEGGTRPGRSSKQEEELLDWRQAMAYLNISQGTLSRRVKAGEITPVFKGASSQQFFNKQELDRYIMAYQADLKDNKRRRGRPRKPDNL